MYFLFLFMRYPLDWLFFKCDGDDGGPRQYPRMKDFGSGEEGVR
jgi:hypothetical protein